MSTNFDIIQPYFDKIIALQASRTLFEWDQQTQAKIGSLETTSKLLGILSDEFQKSFLDKKLQKVYNLCKEDAKNGLLNHREQGILKAFEKKLEQLISIPSEEYRRYNEVAAKSGMVWAKAREDNDYKSFAPYLEEMINYTKIFASYRATDGQQIYDVLLYDYEEGFGMKELDLFFDELKSSIVPLLRKVKEKNISIDKSYNTKFYDIEKQIEFCSFLSEYIGNNPDNTVIAESAHPFTLALHNKDVRFTNHYYENNLESAITSAIHEGGHALYEAGVDDNITITIAGGGTSMGMHESQSRFYENNVGKSRAFWEPIYSKLVDLFPENLNQVSLDHFIQGLNEVNTGFIRIDADELTYALHILVRYEIEKLIFNENVSVYDLPRIWNEKYQEYLGITPPDDRVGILQDTHWAWGNFGYFPSYALGSAIAAQIYAHMEKVLPMEETLREGKLSVIREYLREHIHKYGATMNTNDILIKMTGEGFQPNYYIEYLTKKYTDLYHLNEES